MKTFILAALLLFSASAASFAQAKKVTPFRIREGSKLTYHVEAGGNEYDFIVTVKKLGAEVVFGYEMTSPADKTGSITIGAEAMKSATAWYNYFSGGAKKLSDETSVFVSKGLYKDILSKPTVSIRTGGADSEPEAFTKLSGMESASNGSTYLKMIKEIKGKPYSLDGPILENADGSHAIRIQQTDYFPVITYMQLNFKIYLTGIE